MAFVVDLDRSGPPFSKNEHRVCLVVSALALLAVAGLCLLVCEGAGSVGTPPPSRRSGAYFRHRTVSSRDFRCGGQSHLFGPRGRGLLWIAVVAVQDLAGRLPFIRTPFVLFLLVLVRNTNVILIAFWSLGLFAWGWKRGLRSMGVWLRNAAIVASAVAAAAPSSLPSITTPSVDCN